MAPMEDERFTVADFVVNEFANQYGMITGLDSVYDLALINAEEVRENGEIGNTIAVFDAIELVIPVHSEVIRQRFLTAVQYMHGKMAGGIEGSGGNDALVDAPQHQRRLE